jgi:Methyltransferase domain
VNAVKLRAFNQTGRSCGYANMYKETTTHIAATKYTGGEYAARHPDWHVADAEAKASELLPGVKALAGLVTNPIICDVGTGVGGVPAALMRMLPSAGASQPRYVGLEISEYAVRRGREMHPYLEIRNKPLEESDGPFDATLFADVLEHLENPWEMLRLARRVSRYLLVRQPLLDNIGLFRRNKYEQERRDLGHIAFFNYRSFLDMTLATGWRPHTVSLVAPWEMGLSGGPLLPIKRMLRLAAPEATSFILEGFYVDGLFESVR